MSRRNAPTLQGFLAWLVAGDSEIKRDTETLRDEVRVMTVHGAKGLEADIVFLIDNGTPPSIPATIRACCRSLDDTTRDGPAPLVWMRSVKAMPEAVRQRVKRHARRASRRNTAGCSMSA